jgi:hypothetical protein
MIMAMIVGQGGAVRQLFIVSMVMGVLMTVIVAATVVVTTSMSMIVAVCMTVVMVVNMGVAVVVVMMVVTSLAMVMIAVAVSIAGAGIARSTSDHAHDGAHANKRQERDSSEQHWQVKLPGQNQIERVLLIEQDANQPQQPANDQCADLLKPVVAVTVIM